MDDELELLIERIRKCYPDMTECQKEILSALVTTFENKEE